LRRNQDEEERWVAERLGVRVTEVEVARRAAAAAEQAAMAARDAENARHRCIFSAIAEAPISVDNSVRDHDERERVEQDSENSSYSSVEAPPKSRVRVRPIVYSPETSPSGRSDEKEQNKNFR